MRFFWAILTLCVVTPAQDRSEWLVEKVATGYKFTEGPVWSPEGFLLFADVPSDRVFKYEPGTKPAVIRPPNNGANGMALDTHGRLYVCESQTRRVTRIAKNGRVEVLAEKWEGKHFNAPNDITVRKDGHVYFTDPAFGKALDTRELDFYGVFHIKPSLAVELVAKTKGRPNGIALSPTGNILYVANTDERNVRAYDLDREGRANNERVVISGIDGPPDGIKVDHKGDIFVAARAIAVYSPRGRLLRKIEIAETPSNCAFGGDDGESLYVTARTSVYRVQLHAESASQ